MPSRLRGKTASRGFTFTEILFAVMILGIGFIMVAAMFPVAIQQTQTTNEEAFGAALGRTGYSYLEKIASAKFVVPSHPVPQSVLVPTFFPEPFDPATYQPTAVWLRAFTPAGRYYPLFTAAVLRGQTAITLPGEMWSFRDSRLPQFPGTPANFLADYLWSVLSRNLIIPADPRHAWVAMYRRDIIVPINKDPSTGQLFPDAVHWTPAPYAQVMMIAVEVRNSGEYVDQDLRTISPAPTATLEPFRIPAVTIRRVGNQQTSPWVIQVPSPTIAPMAKVAEGAFVVVSEDNLSGLSNGTYNGRVFRVGAVDPSDTNPNAPTIWQLAPGYDLGPQDFQAMPGGRMPTASVFIIGRSHDSNNAGQFTGLAQDTAVYTSFVPVN